jgi:hypothetical protein
MFLNFNNDNNSYITRVIPLGHEQMGLWFLTSQFAPWPQTLGFGSRQGSLHLNLTQAWKINDNYDKSMHLVLENRVND